MRTQFSEGVKEIVLFVLVAIVGITLGGLLSVATGDLPVIGVRALIGIVIVLLVFGLCVLGIGMATQLVARR